MAVPTGVLRCCALLASVPLLASVLGGCATVRWLKDAYRIDPLFMPVMAPEARALASTVKEQQPQKEQPQKEQPKSNTPRSPEEEDPAEKRACGFWLWSIFNWECRLSEAQSKFRETYGIPLINLNTYRFDGATAGPTAYKQAASDKQARNRLVRQLMTLSDELCAKHQADIMAQSAATNVFLGTATSVLAGAGAIVGGIAAQALSGGGAFTNATRSTINEEIYAKAFAPAIVRNIHTDRPPKGAGIEQRLMKDGTADYPIDLALKEVTEYHQSCSFHNAIVRVSSATERTVPSEADILKRIADLRQHLDTLRTQRDAAHQKWQLALGKPEARELQADYERLEGVVTILTNQLQMAYLQLSFVKPGGALSVPASAQQPGAVPPPGDAGAKPAPPKPPAQ